MTSGRAARIWQFALPPLTIVAVVVAWEALVRLRGIAPIYLPAPSSVFVYLSRMIADGSMPYHLGITLLRIFVGFGLAAVFGIALGVLMGMSRTIARVADVWIAALYPLPKISLIPLLIIWVGTGEAYKIVISAVSAFFPIVISTYSGIRQTDRGLIKAAKDPRGDSQHFCRPSPRHGNCNHSGGGRRDDRRIEPGRHGLAVDQFRACDGNREGLRQPDRACGRGGCCHQIAAMDRPQGRAVGQLPRRLTLNSVTPSPAALRTR